MIPQEAESDDGHQQIRLSKFPTVLTMPRPFTPINGTFSSFVTVNAATRLLRIDLQGIERNTQTDSTSTCHSTTRQRQGKTKAEEMQIMPGI
jgi:hypothetical protein